MEVQKIKKPVWFTVVAVLMIVWDLLGVASFVMGPTLSAEMRNSLPPAEKSLYDNAPLWSTVAFGVSVFGGVLGSILLLLQKKTAKPVFLVAVVAVLVQMTYSIFVVDSIEVYGPGGLVMPILVIFIAFFQIWLTNFGIRRAWLH